MNGPASMPQAPQQEGPHPLLVMAEAFASAGEPRPKFSDFSDPTKRPQQTPWDGEESEQHPAEASPAVAVKPIAVDSEDATAPVATLEEGDLAVDLSFMEGAEEEAAE